MGTAVTMLMLTIFSFALARFCLLALRWGGKHTARRREPDETADACGRWK